MGTYKILALFPNSLEEESDRLKEILAQLKLKGEKVDVTQAWNEKKAWELLGKSEYNLIITDLLLPADCKSIPKEEENHGLILLQRMKERNYHIPSILIVPKKEEKLYEAVENFDWSKLVTYEEIYQPKLCDFVQQAHRLKVSPKGSSEQAILKPPKPLGSIDIRISSDKIIHDKVEGLYNLQVDNLKPLIGYLYFNKKNYDKLIEKSDKLIEIENRRSERSNTTIEEEHYDEWEDKLKEIGSSLADDIFSEENEKFKENFYKLLGKVGGVRNTQIKFNIMKECHSIIFEAITRDTKDDFWMLQAPIYRSVCEIDDDYSKPLFKDNVDRPLNCLIIEADVSGSDDALRTYPQYKLITLNELPHLKRECDWLEKNFFPPYKNQGRINTVERITKQRGVDFYETLTDKFENNDWDLIHYAGHSVYGYYKDADEPTGYLIFPDSEDPDKLKVKSIKEFRMEFRMERRAPGLIYLSSCGSGGSAFVFELVNAGVPAVVGFRWNIRDDLAFKFAQTFYEQLFKKKALERAFFETRRTMYKLEETRTSKIWAAPILIQQG